MTINQQKQNKNNQQERRNKMAPVAIAAIAGGAASAANGIGQMGLGFYNTRVQQEENEKQRKWAHGEAEMARKENFLYGEAAANAADLRQRQQFHDLYSPQQQMKQIKEAGLSPSIMYGGTPQAGGVATGQQGGGANGPAGASTNPNSTAAAYMAGAQFKLIDADAALKMAQALKIEKEIGTEQERQAALQLQNEYQRMINTTYGNAHNLFDNVNWVNEKGEQTSLYNMATQSASFEEFEEKVWKGAEAGGVDKQWVKSETAVQAMRDYYEANKKFGANLTTLQNIRINNDFNSSLISALNTDEFIELTTNDAIQRLRNNVETNKLNSTQKKSWNDLLEKMKDGTTKDILIVCGMILNNALQNYNMPNFRNTTINARNYIE